ncbi:hypothetical protein AWB67_06673 [Caballeronia terrestris]|uniref:Uncharacterized protein n=1 Tax=Caballeronia terrestris TaxID=1226301 RepID=A0A158KTW5_9BURK|nr:hypothetical protein AWB67_06673 [Caballeronia terrestris]
MQLGASRRSVSHNVRPILAFQRSRRFGTRGNHRLLDVIGLAQHALSAFEQIPTFGCERQ